MSQIALQLSRPWETRAGLRRPQEGPITVSVDVAQQIVEAGAVSEEEAERVTELIEELKAEVEAEAEAKPKRKRGSQGRRKKPATEDADADDDDDAGEGGDGKSDETEDQSGKDDKAGASN